MNSVLIIDDDVELCSMLRDYLEPQGFRIDIRHHGLAGFDAMRTENYSMLILDVMLPDMDGFEVLRSLRRRSDIGVLLLSARGSADDRITGLESGADDYLPKPFYARELLARITAILRRGQSGSGKRPSRTIPGENLLTVDDLQMDKRARTVYYRCRPLELTDIEYALMEAFLQAPGQVLSREELVERVFCRQFHPLDRSLDMNMSRLRRKLATTEGLGDRIKTIRSIGYVFTSSN